MYYSKRLKKGKRRPVCASSLEKAASRVLARALLGLPPCAEPFLTSYRNLAISCHILQILQKAPAMYRRQAVLFQGLHMGRGAVTFVGVEAVRGIEFGLVGHVGVAHNFGDDGCRGYYWHLLVAFDDRLLKRIFHGRMERTVEKYLGRFWVETERQQSGRKRFPDRDRDSFVVYLVRRDRDESEIDLAQRFFGGYLLKPFFPLFRGELFRVANAVKKSEVEIGRGRTRAHGDRARHGAAANFIYADDVGKFHE